MVEEIFRGAHLYTRVIFSYLHIEVGSGAGEGCRWVGVKHLLDLDDDLLAKSWSFSSPRPPRGTGPKNRTGTVVVPRWGEFPIKRRDTSDHRLGYRVSQRKVERPDRTSSGSVTPARETQVIKPFL